MADALDVYLAKTLVGRLTLLPGDRSYFAFAENYLANSDRPVLGQSFLARSGGLITETTITKVKLPPFFSNLLPEGHLRTYLAGRGGVNPVREFKLIELFGDDLPGAVIVKPVGQTDIKNQSQKAELKNSEIAQPYRFSLAGVQLKFSALAESAGGLTIPASGVGGDWIVKLPAQNFANVPENEWAMLHLAGKCGIVVPEARLVPLGDIAGLPEMGLLSGRQALAVKRFDRQGELRIHIEDFAQVYNVFPADKYGKVSYDNITNMVWLLLGEKGLLEFVRRLVFTILIGNGDMHLKNWSLIYGDECTPELSPAYDFISTVPYLPADRLALNLAGEKNMKAISLEHFRKLAQKAEVPGRLVLKMVRETVGLTLEVWDKNKLAYDLPAALRKRIEGHMKKIGLLSGR